MDTRQQNLEDAQKMIEVIKNNPSPNLSLIWADLTDSEVDAEVEGIAHLVELLNLS